jgi:hypothetical protein
MSLTQETRSGAGFVPATALLDLSTHHTWAPEVQTPLAQQLTVSPFLERVPGEFVYRSRAFAADFDCCTETGVCCQQSFYISLILLGSVCTYVVPLILAFRRISFSLLLPSEFTCRFVCCIPCLWKPIKRGAFQIVLNANTGIMKVTSQFNPYLCDSSLHCPCVRH